jgi:hypothetical protein
MKNKLLPLLGLIVFSACNTSYVPVRVELPEKDSIDLDRFEQVYFLDFVQHFSEKNYDPQEQIRRYFTYDFSAAIGRKIVTLTLPDWDRIRMTGSPAGFSFPGAVFFQKLLAAYPKALFLTGQLGIDMKTTSIIQEVHDDQGKRKNAFVSKQLWNADAKVVLIESDSGKIVVEKSHSEKTTIDNLFVLRYQFGLLLDRLGDKLLPDLQKKKRFQERYILR